LVLLGCPLRPDDECHSWEMLASPFLLVHGVGHDERTWFPIFSVCYFHHDRDGDVARLHSQAHTMDGIAVGRSPNPMRFWFTIHGRRNITSLTLIVLIPFDYLLRFIHHSLTKAVSSAHYTVMPIHSWRKRIHRARESNALTLPHTCSWRVWSWISLFTLIPLDRLCT
jgi:hypothetical protein